MPAPQPRRDLRREDIPDTRPRLQFDQIEQLLIYLLKHPTVFLEARVELKKEHFNQAGEAARGLMWQKQMDWYARYQAMPDMRVLEAEVVSAMAADPNLFTVEMQEDIVGLLEAVREYPVDVLTANESYGRDLLRAFLEERMLMDPLVSIVSSIRQGVFTNTAEILDRLVTTHSRILATGNQVASTILPDGWAPVQEMPSPTGIDWLDAAADGGFVATWVYGLFGPFGSFKTGTAIQIGVSYAAQLTASARNPQKAKLVVYVVYEGGEDPIRLRALGCAAKIPHKNIMTHFSGGEPLSVMGNLKQYEIDRYNSFTGTPVERFGETERLTDAVQRTANFIIVDMSGSRKNPGSGKGGVPEIVAAIDRLQRESGQEVGLVIIDYAKLMIRRYVQEKGISLTDMRHHMGGLPDSLRQHIGERWNVPVLVLQQLNTAANKRAAGAVQHHSDSSEAGDFGENLNYAYTLSSIDKRNGYTIQFAATKTRDGPGLAEPIILQVVGDEERLIEANSRFTISPNGRISLRSVSDLFVGDGSGAQRTIDPESTTPTNGPRPQPRTARVGTVGYTPPPEEPRT